MRCRTSSQSVLLIYKKSACLVLAVSKAVMRSESSSKNRGGQRGGRLNAVETGPP